jgi:hypothetical protein
MLRGNLDQALDILKKVYKDKREEGGDGFLK